MNLHENINRIKTLMNIDVSKSFIIEGVEDKSYEISYDYNPEISELQKFLVDKKYYIGNFGSNKDGVDGKYGPFTKAAHEAFKNGMPPEEYKNKRAEMAQEYIGDVGDEVLKKEFNFHLIPDGNNNYRSAQIPVTLKGKDYLGEVIDKYGIKTIIRFNGDGNDGRHYSTHPVTTIEEERNLANSKGIKFYKLSSTKDQDKVNSLLSQGNVLIHCAHGADRTGGNVGGYLLQKGWGDTEKIWNYTTQYNGWNRMVKNSPNSFVSGGYLKQAQKFGVKDLNHALELTKSTKKIVSSRTKSANSNSIIIGDSQVPYIDNATSKASKLSDNGDINSLWKGGVGVSWLIKSLNQREPDSNISNVVISIGTNGGFGKYSNDNIPRLFSLLREKFPNAKFHAVQGSWGWGSLKDISEKDVSNYYKKFQEQGAIVINPPIGRIEPHGNRPIYKVIGAALDSQL